MLEVIALSEKEEFNSARVPLVNVWATKYSSTNMDLSTPGLVLFFLVNTLHRVDLIKFLGHKIGDLPKTTQASKYYHLHIFGIGLTRIWKLGWLAAHPE